MDATKPTPEEVLNQVRIDLKLRDIEGSYVTAENPIQECLISFWEEVLETKPIGLNDDFFNLGGDSLHMAMIASRINDRFAVTITFEDFFSFPLLKDLAARVEKLRML